MPTYERKKPVCVKCGAGPSKIVTTYEAAHSAFVVSTGDPVLVGERLRLTCACGYNWSTPCLDAAK